MHLIVSGRCPPHSCLPRTPRSIPLTSCLILLLACLGQVDLGRAQQQPGTVTIRVDAATTLAPWKPAWNFFGADEPNYTYAPNGTKLLRELHNLDPCTPVYFRPHNLLTSGDGSASLKWGSTGVYSEKPDGTPVYNWTITDRLFDNLVATGITPMVEIGFMPEALSTHPEPYRHTFPTGDIFTGWSYPPKDYAKWRALIVAWVTHLRDRYPATIANWLWEVWNEPDIPYFHGTLAEYERLYDITTAAVRKFLPHAKVGGPAATGPYPHEDPSKNSPYLHDFLDHAAHGINADTGKPGAPLDFISFHPKGSPKFLPATAGTPAHVQMNLASQLGATELGMQIVASFPEFKDTPIILSESDPEGCAACQGPQNGYRNGTLYGVSVAEMLARSAEFARLHHVNLQGAVTWAFEFEDQPPFAGFRELATNGIDKPVLNVFRLFAMLHGDQVQLTSSGAIPLDQVVAHSARTTPDVDGVAVRGLHSLDILLWNYHDEDLAAPPAPISLELTGLPTTHATLTEFRVDHDHANSYTAWHAIGSPQHPTPDQLTQLQKASQLAPSPATPQRVTAGRLTLNLSLPRQAVTLLHLTW